MKRSQMLLAPFRASLFTNFYAPCLALILGSASVATAEGREIRLAPAGPCAEARVAAGVAPVSPFSVVGSPANLLSPVDVAAGPPQVATVFDPPSTSKSGPGRGPCDNPGTGCGIIAPMRASSNPAITSLMGRPGAPGPSNQPSNPPSNPPISSLMRPGGGSMNTVPAPSTPPITSLPGRP